MKTEFAVEFKNPIKLDVTCDAHGRSVQWNGDAWLLYDSKEAEEFREFSLKDFRERQNNLKLLEQHHWNAAIQRCMDLLEANRKISDYDKENLSYAMRRLKK